jgi:putative inorganic carbon (hco3(-)) transporter
MIQVSLVGFAVGGAFLNLAYFGVPYDLLVALVLTRLQVEKRLNELELKEGAPAPEAIEEMVSEHGVVAVRRLDAQVRR